jgi:hypothetical protein
MSFGRPGGGDRYRSDRNEHFVYRPMCGYGKIYISELWNVGRSILQGQQSDRGSVPAVRSHSGGHWPDGIYVKSVIT